MFVILPILRNIMAQMNRNAQLVLGVVEDNSVQLPTVSIERWRIRILLRGFLDCDNLSRVPLMDSEAVFSQIDTQRAHTVGNNPIRPSLKDSPCIGAEGYNVTQLFELYGRGLENTNASCVKNYTPGNFS